MRFRCQMHGFGLVMKSVLDHNVAQAIIASASRVVRFSKRSHAFKNALKQRAKTSGAACTGTLKSANGTRMTSVELCLSSVKKHELVLKAIMMDEESKDKKDRIVKQDVADIISVRLFFEKLLCNFTFKSLSKSPFPIFSFPSVLQDDMFWIKIKGITELLEPFSQIIMACQSADTSLSDIVRYWGFLGGAVRRVLATQAQRLGSEYLRHVAVSYCRRFMQLDLPLARLGFFLDPRYKIVLAEPGGDGLCEEARIALRNVARLF